MPRLAAILTATALALGCHKASAADSPLVLCNRDAVELAARKRERSQEGD
jgi:hypothetical protein